MMAETLTRTYHGHEVVSTMNDEPVDGSDGWSHVVDGSNYTTLADAIRHAKSGNPVTSTRAGDTTTIDITPSDEE